MECNKEEAIRAKNFAEIRMKSQDFEGAQKIALKARSLFPDLEGISQILTVCEVHCAAGTKIGGETDWYAVLQVEMMADDSTIRKQYRKFALQLHPDKNKLAGAETAFQLVGDAYKILSDPKKRSQYNVIRRTNFCSVSLNQASRQSYRPSGRKQPGPGVSSVAAKSTFVNFGGSNQNQPSPFLGVSTFWATCPSCNVGLQFYHNTLSKHVQCQKCFNIFAANELKTHGMSGSVSSAKAVSGAEFQKPKVNDSAFKQRSRPEYSSGSKNNVRDGKRNDFSTKVNDEKIQNAQYQSANTPASQMRRNEESETQKLKDEKDSNFLRRSARNKRNASVECLPSASKRLKQGKKQANGVPNDTVYSGKTEENGKRSISSELNKASAADSSSKASVDQENLTYPAPIFCNFESARSENKFVVGQVWAIYDNIDGMPRYYARVKKVYSREFKLQLTWLENDPRSITEMRWSEQGLPIVCGNFKHGKLYNTLERHIFSHLVQWRLGTKRNSYVIYPQRGEIWALFKNWNIGWGFKPDKHRTYEYQIVEVVSDFSEAAGISVVRLARIKEFMALFIRADDAEESLLEIPAKDVLIFSHRIPACRIVDKKEEGVPECAYELDCASLPRKFEEIFPSISLKGWTKNVTPNVEFSQSTAAENGFKPIGQNAIEKSESGSKSSEFSKMTGTSETVFVNSNGSQQNAFSASQKLSESKNMKLRSDASPEADNIGSSQKSENPEQPSLIAFEYPESEFYNFEDDRLMVKFECGQVWAFYCEIDNFPKYYGKIRRVDRENNRVNVRWLESYSALGANEGGAEDRPLLACGSFRATKETSTMDSGETFSHQANAKPMAEKNHFYIFPDVGEVWAVFTNWNATSSSSSSDHQGYEFEVVEIISSRTASKIEAHLLTKVDGHVSVFCRKKRGPDAVMLIPFSEPSRFSHRIPAYRLEREMGGAGYWELDPAAVPAAFLS